MRQGFGQRTGLRAVGESPKSKIIKVFVNGENKCYSCEINPKIIKTWSNILVHISSTVNAKFGAVRRLLALSSLQQVNGFHELNATEKYIALGEFGSYKRASKGYKSPAEDDVIKILTNTLIKRRFGEPTVKPRTSTREAVRNSTKRYTDKKDANLTKYKSSLRAKSLHSTEISTSSKLSDSKTSTERKTQSKQQSTSTPVTNTCLKTVSLGPLNKQKCLKQTNKIPIQSRPAKRIKPLNQQDAVTPQINEECYQTSQNKTSNLRESVVNKERKDGIRVSSPTQAAHNRFHAAMNEVNKVERLNTCSSPINHQSEIMHSSTSPIKVNFTRDRSVGKLTPLQQSLIQVEPNLKRAHKTESKDVTEDMKKPSKDRSSKGNKIEHELQRLMDLEKKKYMISMYALKHVNRVLQDLRRHSIVKKDSISIRSSRNKNIFRPSPTVSIQDLTAKTQSTTVQKSRQTLVIPQEAITKRMQELSTTIVAYKRKISEINDQICADYDKLENGQCLNNSFHSCEQSSDNSRSCIPGKSTILPE